MLERHNSMTTENITNKKSNPFEIKIIIRRRFQELAILHFNLTFLFHYQKTKQKTPTKHRKGEKRQNFIAYKTLPKTTNYQQSTKVVAE